MFDASGSSDAGGAAVSLAPVPVPVPVSDDAGEGVLAALEGLTARLRDVLGVAGSAASWSPAVRARVLGALDRVPGLLAGVRAPVLAAVAAQAAAAGNERGFVDTRARLTGATRWQASGQVETARVLGELEHVRVAVVDSVMPVGHADVLARKLGQASPKVMGALSELGTQAKVVELARGTDAREFSRSLDALVATVDPDAAGDAREASRRARFLSLSHTSDGTFVKGRLDPVSGHVLARALDATGHRADPDRTAEQARADALTAVARHALTAGIRPNDTGAAATARTVTGSTTRSTAATAVATTGPGTWSDRTSGAVARAVDALDELSLPDGATSAPTAQISLVVPAETWLAVRALQQRRRGRTDGRANLSGRKPLGTPSGPTHNEARPDRPSLAEAPPDDLFALDLPAVPSGASRRSVATLAPVPVATTDDGTPISHTELAAALCDCAMTRVVMTSAGLPLDVGRSRRMFTPAQRAAVVARDRGCAWNGCSAPQLVCEVHHIAWWHRDGGTTDLTNAVLLCSFHHHEVHRRDLDIHRLPSGPAEAGPRHSGAAPPPLDVAVLVVGHGGLAPTRYRFTERNGRIANDPIHLTETLH
jgi:hypothetical protein